MKKRLFIVVLIFSTLLCSCDKIGSGGISSSYLEGAWVNADKYYNPDEVLDYYEFSKNGVVSVYSLSSNGKISIDDENFYGSFKNGTLYVPAGKWWEKCGAWEYRIEGDELMFAFFSGKIKKLDKDTFVYESYGGMSELDGTNYRIKKFSTK